jgi:bifunctional non-homologous end joining protein LigD
VAARTVETRRYGGRDVALTNLSKVLFPADGITKRDVIAHVEACAAPLLDAVRSRALSMERRVDGLAGPGFFHKHVPKHFPDWIASAETPTSRGPMRQVVIEDLAGLVLVTNFGCLTPHVPTTRVDRPFHPTELIVDLDPPDADEDVPRLRRAALQVRAALAARGLPAFPRWTGSRGVHVVVPSDGSADSRQVAALAEHLARALVAEHPALFTTAFAKVDRGGRIYLDMGRNWPMATCVASFAIRPRPGAPLAMPVSWDELDETGPRTFTIRDGPARVARDAWAGFDAARTALAEPRDPA